MTKYTHISIKERESIFLMLHEGKKPSEIARSLGRDKGTLSRELERNPVLIQGKIKVALAIGLQQSLIESYIQ